MHGRAQKNRRKELRFLVPLVAIREGSSLSSIYQNPSDKLIYRSAAIYGLRNKANVSIFILHPKGRVSPIQEAQMTTVTDANVHNVAVKGTFDDCQVRVSKGNIDHNPYLNPLGHRESSFRRSRIQRFPSFSSCQLH